MGLKRIFDWENREKKSLFIVLAAGLAVRAAYAWLAASVAPWNDMALYDSARLAILQHGKYIWDWPPVYPALLAAVTLVFGEGPLKLYLAQALLSSLTCLLIYLTAKETFNRPTGVIALFISCFYVDMIWYSGVLLAETLGVLMLCGVVYLLLRRKSPVLTGLLFGLTCLAKGVYLVTFPALLVWIYLIYDRNKAVSAVVKFAVFTFLAISPWTIRNFSAYGGFVLIAPQDGASVFLGHNPSATGGADFFFLGEDYGRFYSDNSLTMLQKNKEGFRLGLEYALSHPLREAQLFFLKLSKYWSLRTHFDPNNGPYPLRTAFFFLSIATHFLLLPACFLGAFFSLENRKALISTFTIGINTLVFVTLFFATGRMRFQLAPFIIILGSYGFYLLPELVSRVRKSELAGISGRLAASAAVTLLLYANFIYQIAEKHKDIARRF